MAMADQLYFYLVKVFTLNMIVSLTISKLKSIDGEVVIDFSKCYSKKC